MFKLGFGISNVKQSLISKCHVESEVGVEGERAIYKGTRLVSRKVSLLVRFIASTRPIFEIECNFDKNSLLWHQQQQ